MVAAPDTDDAEAAFAEGRDEAGTVDGGESGSCGDDYALDADELQVINRGALDFKAEFDGFSNPLGYFVEGPPLRVASRDPRNRGDVAAFGIALDDNVELAWQRQYPRLPL